MDMPAKTTCGALVVADSNTDSQQASSCSTVQDLGFNSGSRVEDVNLLSQKQMRRSTKEPQQQSRVRDAVVRGKAPRRSLGLAHPEPARNAMSNVAETQGLSALRRHHLSERATSFVRTSSISMGFDLFPLMLHGDVSCTRCSWTCFRTT
eukprot:3126553-Rhodomonas_salina.3